MSEKNLAPPSFTCNSSHSPKGTLFWFTHFSLGLHNDTVKFIGLVDTGANCNTISRHIIPGQYHNLIVKTDSAVNGIGGGQKSVGTLTVDVKLGDTVFRSLQFIVCDSPRCPTIIGLPVLHHPTVTELSFKFPKQEMVFRREKDSSVSTHTIKCFERSDSTPDYPEVVQCFSTTVTAPKFDNLEGQIRWLKSQLGIDLSHPDKTELQRMADLLVEFYDVFGSEDFMGQFPKEVSIPTKGGPKAVRVGQIPLAKQKLVDNEVAKMLSAGVIEECVDCKGWNTPMILVSKKDGTWRPCSNFKPTLNKVLVDEEVWSQHSTDELFNKVRPNNKYFTSVDLMKGYWQIQIKPEDRHKTSFQWRGKRYQYVRLPFGLKSAGSIFSKCVADALVSENLDVDPNILLYLDDMEIQKIFDIEISFPVRYLYGQPYPYLCLRSQQFQPARVIFHSVIHSTLPNRQ